MDSIRRPAAILVAAVLVGATLLVTSGAAYPASAATAPMWYQRYIGTAGGLGALSCPSTTTCAVVGYSGGKLGGALALTTTNGGTTWTPHVVGLPVDSVAEDLATVACPTVTECLASGSISGQGTQDQIVITHDLWTHWSLQTLPGAVGKVTGLACPDARECWADGYNQYNGDGITNSYVFRTTDGGAKWKAMPIPSGTVWLTGITCPTVDACWASGSNSYKQPMIIATTDRGAKWTTQTLPSGLAYPMGGVSCATVTHCMAVTVTQGDAPATIITSDGGVHWRMTASEEGYVGGGPWAVSCVTNDYCAVVNDPFPGSSEYAGIYITSNQGRSWQGSGGEGVGLWGLDCVKPADCWVAGEATPTLGFEIMSTVPPRAG